MNISKNAKWGIHKRFDNNREIVIAKGKVNGQNETQFFVKCQAFEFQKSRQYCSCCNKFSRRFDLEHKEWICDLCEDERGV
jgi:hypothetical protein